MKNKRYYVDTIIKIGEIITLEGEEFLHLVQVMRSKVGTPVTLFNGDGYDYDGVIQDIQKKNALIKIESLRPNITEPERKVTLFQALVKGDKLSTIVQKNTEIGTYEIVLFESEFSDVKLGEKNIEKQKKVVIQASKQCGASVLMKVGEELSFGEMLTRLNDFDICVFAYENEHNRKLSDVLTNLQNKSKIAVIIGPEGGFSEKEAKMIEENGAISVSLGKRILRAETAGIVLPAAIILGE